MFNTSALLVDTVHMRQALTLAKRGVGYTSPNPMVGAVLVKRGQVIGRGWHRRAGGPHAEVAAILDAKRRGHSLKSATLYVTLEPCCTQGRTPPCTDTIKNEGIKRVVVGAKDPNPSHAGRAFRILRRAGVKVTTGILAEECGRLNESFNHWIVHHTPYVTVKAAMTLDGKIATEAGESKWITGEKARLHAMKLRRSNDAILVGINTVLADDPSLTVRGQKPGAKLQKTVRRIVLDSMARTPLTARIVTDEQAALTTIVVSQRAPKSRVAALECSVRVLVAPSRKSTIHNSQSAIDPRWLLRHLGRESVTSLLVEGGGEVNASFLMNGLAHRVAFFYAPKILGGNTSRKAVGGIGVGRLDDVIRLQEIKWRKLGEDMLMTARVHA